MSMEGSRQRLQASLRELKVQWERTRLVWQDAAAAEFGERYVDALDQAIRAAMPAMEMMAESVARLRRECGDPP